MDSPGWELIADRAGGTVACLASATSGDGRTVVFAATSVGIFRSFDAGRSWALAGSVPFAEVVLASPRFAQDATLFVCAGDELHRSQDGGESWQRVLVGSRMLSVSASLCDEQLAVLAGTETDGVLRSDDGGRTWTGANAGLLDLAIIALALSPAYPDDRTAFVGTPTGLYRTRNAARSWRDVDTGLDAPAVQCLAVSPDFAQDRTVLAGTEADGLLRSTDGGTTWHSPSTLTTSAVTALAFSARGKIAAATDSGIAVSDDKGATWRTASAEPQAILSLIFLEDGAEEVLLAGKHRQGAEEVLLAGKHRRGAEEVLLAGTHRHGVFRSADVGQTWTPANASLSAGLLTSLVLSPAFANDQTLFAADLEEGVSVSRDGGQTWNYQNNGLEDPTVVGLAVSPSYADDRTVYTATPAGIYVSRDGAATWHRLLEPSAPARALLALPDSSLLIALTGGKLLTHPTQSTPPSVQGEASGSSERTPQSALGDAFGSSEIISLDVSPDYQRDRTLFIATSSSSQEVVLWRSTDAGASWHRWLVEPAPRDVLPLALPPGYTIDELIFVGLHGRVLRPVRNARQVRSGQRLPIWRGVDVGDGGLVVSALATSPNFRQDRTVFAATNAGVFVSRDGGDSYQAWSDGLEGQPRSLPAMTGQTVKRGSAAVGLSASGFSAELPGTQPASQLPVMALAISPAYGDDRLVFGVSLGGAIWRRRDVTS